MVVDTSAAFAILTKEQTGRICLANSMTESTGALNEGKLNDAPGMATKLAPLGARNWR